MNYLVPALLSAGVLLLLFIATQVMALDEKVDKLAIIQAGNSSILRLLEAKVLK